MAPRGRGRPRKRNTRMDPAIEQMSMYGFPEKLVREKMKTLLEIYDGEWVFIETDNYAVLLEAILEEINENNNNEESSVKEETTVDKSVLEEEKKEITDSTPDVGSSSRDVKAEPDDENSIRDSGRSENQMLVEDHEKRLEPIEVKKEMVSSLVVGTVVNPPLVEANSLQIRFKPSYGWISDGDDDHDFIQLEPMPHLPVAPTTTIDDSKQKRRKTRWDVKPDDLI